MKLSLMTFMVEVPLIFEGKEGDDFAAAIDAILSAAANAGYEMVDLVHVTILKLGVEKMKELLDKNHLKLNCVLYLGVLEDMSLIPFILDTSNELNFRKLMLVPGRIHEGNKEELGLILCEAFREIVGQANSYGITCVIEDDPNITYPMCSTEELHKILDQIPDLRMVYDTANMLPAGETPAEYFLQFKDKIAHMHIKDMVVVHNPEENAQIGMDGRYYKNAPHREGVIPFGQLISLFRDCGYDDTMAVEFLPREGWCLTDDLRDVREYLLSLWTL